MFPFVLPGFTVEIVHVIADQRIVQAQSQTVVATCPLCSQPSSRVHSRYLRAPRDLPVSAYQVQLHLSVRRFFCDNRLCAQRTFGERFPDLLPFHAQRTSRLSRSLQHLGFALGGEAGAALSGKLFLRTSPDTLLRIIRQVTCPVFATPRVLGVDDFALRKGRVYGTILVDLEAHRPVDLLPDRTATTLATWLRAHPGVTILSRDRSTEYTRGAREGAPNARQVADRWHLLHNLREVLERICKRAHPRLRSLLSKASAPQPDTQTWKPRRLRPPTSNEQFLQTERRVRRLERYNAVRRLASAGVSLREIARQLQLSRKTVQRFAQAERFPERAVRQSLPTQLDPYCPYLQQRWREGCRNGTQLWRELVEQGFASGPRQVMRWAQHQRDTPAPTTPPAHIRSLTTQSHHRAHTAPRQLSWLLLKTLDDATKEEQTYLTHLKEDEQMGRVYDLVQRFVQMMHEQRGDGLKEWLAQCARSDVVDLKTFADALSQDEQAVRNALEEPWSNGQVEGQVTRLKCIKRQMYGRAKFDLLRQRVLHQT